MIATTNDGLVYDPKICKDDIYKLIGYPDFSNSQRIMRVMHNIERQDPILASLITKIKDHKGTLHVTIPYLKHSRLAKSREECVKHIHSFIERIWNAENEWEIIIEDMDDNEIYRTP